MKKFYKGLILSGIMVSTVFTTFASYIIFNETIVHTVMHKNKTEYEEAQEDYTIKNKPIYDLQYKEEVPPMQQMAGLVGTDEASIIWALTQILGSWNHEVLAQYLGIPAGYKSHTIWQYVVPTIAGELQFNVNAACSIAQATHEFGWDHSLNGGKRPSAFEWKNLFGIKAAGDPNEYWDGSSQYTSTHEGAGSGKVSIKAGFRKYPTFWHSGMDHARLLTHVDRYKKQGFEGCTDPTEFSRKLKAAGYHTDSLSHYTNSMLKIYNTNHLEKINALVQRVREVMARSGGGMVTPGGVAIPGSEWMPQNSLGGIQVSNSNRITKNFRKGNNRRIEYIVIHDTANTDEGADAKVHFNYFNNNSRGASAHYVVDDHSIIQCVDDKNIAFHCGDSKRGQYDRTISCSNNNSIGIEMCVNKDGSFKTTVQKTLYLTKQLMMRYNIPLNRVIRHHDVTGKICPQQFQANNWRMWGYFKRDLQYLVQGSNASGMGPIYGGGATGVTGGGGTSLQGGLLRGQTIKVKFTMYYPDGGPMEGGWGAANGDDLRKCRQTCAAPSQVDFNTAIQPFGTGTQIDGKIYRVNDRGGGITINNGVYDIDILATSKAEMDRFGVKYGQAIMGNGTGTSIGQNSYKPSGGSGVVANSGETVPSKITQVVVTGDGRSAAASAGVNYDALPAARKAILDIAAKQLGKPYQWGATGPNKFDCSGLVQFVYRNALGVDIPRTSSAQANWKGVRTVSEDQARPGDLVYHPGHIMIFLRNSDKPGKPIVLHAPHTGDVVKIGYASGKNNVIKQLK